MCTGAVLGMSHDGPREKAAGGAAREPVADCEDWGGADAKRWGSPFPKVYLARLALQEALVRVTEG